jgi:class 3 adenylate cyclase/streptogramin lyase
MKRGRSSHMLATVMFTDIVGSSEVAAELGDRRWRVLLAFHHRLVRQQLKRFGGTEVDTAGDGFFASFADQEYAVRCACAISDVVRELGLELRSGVHVGRTEGGGRALRGIAVHIGARVMAVAGPGEVLVSGVLKDLIPGSEFTFADCGLHRLKGIPDEVRLFAVTGVDGTPRPPPLKRDEARRRRNAIKPPPLLPRPRRRREIFAAVGVIAVAIAVAFAFYKVEGASSPPLRIVPNSLLRIDARSTHLMGDVPVANPGETELGVVPPDQVWVLSHADQVISIVDARTTALMGPIGGFGGPQLGKSPASFALLYAYGSVWVAAQNDTVVRINPTSHKIEKVIHVPGGPSLLAAGFRHLWVLLGDVNRLYAIDPKTNRPRFAARTKPATDGLAVGEGAVWVVNYLAGTVSKIDPHTGKSTTITVGASPAGIGVGYGSVRVSNTGRPGPVQTISQIDPATNRVVDTIPVGKSTNSLASDIAAVNGSMWVTCPASRTVVRIEATTARVIGRVHLPIPPIDLTTAYGSVWVTLLRHYARFPPS